jgi:hypothetical protein
MQYLTKDIREVYIYDFEKKEKDRVLSFTKRDGLVSHMKFVGDNIFYVKNTKEIIVINFYKLI